MKKIIVKCKLENRDNFEDKLASFDFDFGPMYWQHDRVYVPRGYKHGMNYPRLVMRTNLKAVDEQPEYYLILRRHIEDSGVDIVEKTPVSDYSTAVNIILQLGFKQIGEVSRHREELAMGEGTMIFIDDVDGRDESYAKIESTLSDSESVTETREKLLKMLTAAGETNIIELPYFEL